MNRFFNEEVLKIVGGKTLKKKSEGFVLEKVLEEDLGDSFLKLSLSKTLKGVYIKDHH